MIRIQKAVILKIELSPVLVIDLGALADKDHETIIRRSVELGHAIGNQHWPAVVKGTKVYVPLTVDKKVMLSVMETHNLEGISYDFQKESRLSHILHLMRYAVCSAARDMTATDSASTIIMPRHTFISMKTE